MWRVPVPRSDTSSPVPDEMTPEPLFELWHHGTLRCLMTGRDERPPFCVDIYDGDQLISHREFGDHDAAIECAVKALRRTTGPPSAPPS
jgi:hypothetical protein